LKIKLNKYCIDWKKHLTEFIVIKVGSYVCKNCVLIHKEQFGDSDEFPIAKHVYNELWDDW